MSKKTKIIIAVVAVFLGLGIIGILTDKEEPNASSTGITDFTFRDASSVNLELSDSKFYNSTPDNIESYVTVDCKEASQVSDESVIFVSDNENVAIIELVNILKYSKRYNFKISAKGAGTTTVYVKTSDGKVVSPKITVNVVDKRTVKEDVTEESTTTTTTMKSDESSTTTTTTTKPTTTTTTTKTTTTTTQKPGRTVYVTPKGKCYHFDKDCAGKNAIARDLNDVKGSYGPCGTCVQ